jgi:hypothetical protein
MAMLIEKQRDGSADRGNVLADYRSFFNVE